MKKSVSETDYKNDELEPKLIEVQSENMRLSNGVNELKTKLLYL